MSKYRIAKSTRLDEVVDSTATLDGAFQRARELSREAGKFGAVFCVYSSEDTSRDGDKRVRIFAQAGVARWARPCTARANTSGTHHGCHVCGGLGLVEDFPS